MYMESRKMELVNLFAGQQWRNSHRVMGMGREEEMMSCMERVTCKLTCPYIR